MVFPFHFYAGKSEKLINEAVKEILKKYPPSLSK
jgi:DNA polymerase III delta subunit